MSKRTDILDLAQLGLSSGEGRRLDLVVEVKELSFGGEQYTVEPSLAPVILDISATTGHGFVFRLRFDVELTGPCMRCLETAYVRVNVDTHEVHQPSGGEELRSPYLNDEIELELSDLARDALALALPTQIMCKPECAGLCPTCGANLNKSSDHSHPEDPDPRWSKLSEIHFE